MYFPSILVNHTEVGLSVRKKSSDTLNRFLVFRNHFDTFGEISLSIYFPQIKSLIV